MKRKSLLFLLLFALLAPWAANAQNSIPFNEGFESMTSVDDLTAAGWTLSTTESGTFLAIESNASNVYEGTKSLNLDAWDASSSSSVQYLGLPLVAGDLNTLQISFAYKVTSGTINVGYLTDATDFSTFTSLAQYSSSSSFTVKTTDLSEAPANAARLVLKYTGWYRCYLDNFEVKVLPSCQAATSITASDITATSATIAWEGEGDTWNLKYNGIEVNGISAMSYNLTGLTDATNYTVSVQNVCSDGSTTDWISTTFRTPELCPDGKICIGEGTATNSYLPTYNYYDYSLTEQIYTAEEIGQAGAILSVDIYSVGTVTRTLEFYMVSTEKETFTDGTDWIVATESDLLYNGSVTFAANSWNTIEFDNPFIYDGSSNVALIVRDMTGDYVSSINFYVFDAPSQAIRIYRDNTPYDLANPGSGTVMDVKNRVRLVVGEPPACPKPMGLTVNYTGGTEATISWTSDATAWNMRVNGTPINGTITNPYTLTGLELATTYEVEVQANCGDATSEWAGPVSFITDACMPENMCEITYELADSFGDGWNGNYINVVDVETEAILATWTISSGSSASGTLALCDGRAIQFQYRLGTASNTYPAENSWVIKDVNGEVIWEYSSPSASMSQDYTMSCVVTSCRKPTDLAATDIFGHSAKLSWTENGEATEWVIDYNGTTLTVNENPYVLEGLVPETAYTVKVKPVCDEEKWSDEITFTTDVACPAPTFEVEAAAESATITIAGEAETYNVRYRTPRGFNYGFEQAEAWTYTDFDPCTVYDGDGGTTYGLNGYTFTNQYYVGACIAFQNGINDNFAAHNGNAFGVMFNSSEGQSNDWFILPELTIERGSVFSFWGREITTQYGDETINVGVYGSSDGTFASLLAENVAVSTTVFTKFEYDLSEYAGQTIRLAINCVSNDIFGFMFDDIFVGNPEDDTWDYTFNEVNSPYEITGLTSETEYEVQVQANCGEDGVSAWSATVVFMTKPLCEVPTNVAVADITTNSAVVTWESEATSFDIEVNGVVTEDVTSPYTLNDLDPGTAYSVRVRANCGETGYSAWTTAVDFATSCLAYELPYEYGFETADDMNCWSVMAANSANLLGRINITAQEIEDFAAYEGDYGFVFSSYNQADAYQQVLMSPELNSGDAEVAFEFYYRAYGSGTEEVYVLYSTTTNDLEEFEMADAIEADNTDEWLQYQTTLPAGTKYVALYYNSNFQYYLFVDGFKFEEAVGVTQVLELSAGWNNISVYLAVEDPVAMLDQLKEGLGDNAIAIEGKDGYTSYEDGEWFGELDEIGLMNEQSYNIQVSADCTVELQGMPANPADYAITINPGWNWIGFPSAEELEIAVALAEFEAADEDVIDSPLGYTMYDGGEWFGEIETLVPGVGYMYLYNGDGPTTLVFQTGSKARRSFDVSIVKDVKDIRKGGSEMTRKQAMVIKTVKK